MSTKIRTELGCALPPASRHAITFNLPQWSNLLRFIEGNQAFFDTFKNVYPRMLLHNDIKTLGAGLLKYCHAPEDQTAFIFTSFASASQCVEFATASERGDEQALPLGDISIRVFDVKNDVRLYVVIFPKSKASVVLPFWRASGKGISSRLAEECLNHIEALQEVAGDASGLAPIVKESEAHSKIRDRIAELLERAPVGPYRRTKVSPKDIYLFQCGMAAIYSTHKYILQAHGSKSILFGFAFDNTLQVFQFFGPGYKFFGRGADDELKDVAQFLESQKEKGENVQAIWAEFPTNPLLTVPQLSHLRELAHKYGSLLIVDDTIGSFCNVDLLSDGVDIIITSLTKSFSGYADVMGASVVLNPASTRYSELKAMFERHYSNEYCSLDAVVMEKNSQDYLERSTLLNNNALALVNFLDSKAKDPSSSVREVYYPTTSPTSLVNYTAYLRPVTTDFKPGYGCLFSVEFATIEATQAFYDNLNTHAGPHLGAHLTIAVPYVKAMYGKKIEWAQQFGLKDTQIRVAPGLEDTKELIEVFAAAVAVADQVKTNIKEE